MKYQTELIGLFEYKTKLLGEALDRGEIYDAIEVAGLTRDLLLSDTNGLMGALLKDLPALKNRRNRKIRFEVKFLGSTYHSNLDKFPLITEAPNKTMICPHKEFDGTQSFNRHEFLSLPILCTEQGHYSYKDLISFVANKLGSRHLDLKTGSEKQLVLHEIREKFGFEGFDPIVSPLFGLGSVVYTTCNKISMRLKELEMG